MEDKITGIHHITAIADDARRNLEFYTRVLGLRMVKKTVNFDDPGTYHFYYGNETGTPGTILTFFPWEGIVNGRAGTGMATEIGYSVAKDSLEFWADRFRQFDVRQGEVAERMGETYLPFRDSDDGLNFRPYCFPIPGRSCALEYAGGSHGCCYEGISQCDPDASADRANRGNFDGRVFGYRLEPAGR